MGYMVIGIGTILYRGNASEVDKAYKYIVDLFTKTKQDYWNVNHTKGEHTFEMSENKSLDYSDMEKIESVLDKTKLKYELFVNEFVESGEGFTCESKGDMK